MIKQEEKITHEPTTQINIALTQPGCYHLSHPPPPAKVKFHSEV